MDINFITVTPDSGQGGGTLNVTASSNSSAEESRDVKFIIHTSGLDSTVNITQNKSEIDGILLTEFYVIQPEFQLFILNPPIAEGSQMTYFNTGSTLAMTINRESIETTGPVENIFDIQLGFMNEIISYDVRLDGTDQAGWNVTEVSQNTLSIQKQSYVTDTIAKITITVFFDKDDNSKPFHITITF